MNYTFQKYPKYIFQNKNQQISIANLRTALEDNIKRKESVSSSGTNSTFLRKFWKNMHEDIQ